MMSLTAKPVVKDKFWIVEDSGNKVATIQMTVDGVVFVHNEYREKFASVKLLSKKYNITFDKTKPKKVAREEHFVYEYPASSKPFNELFDVTKKLPIFTKTKKSKSFYCAGYYLVKFTTGWVKSFAPKFITLNRYEFRGPFKTKTEMQEYLQSHNDNTNP